MTVVQLTGKDNLSHQCPVTVNSDHVAEIRPKQTQQPMGLSQNPQTVQVPVGTEILYGNGHTRVVAESHDVVSKLLWPPVPEVGPTLESYTRAPEPQKRSEPPKAGVPVSDKKLAAQPEPEKTAPKTSSQGASNDSGSQAPAAHSS